MLVFININILLLYWIRIGAGDVYRTGEQVQGRDCEH
jgi:hypothetical protein